MLCAVPARAIPGPVPHRFPRRPARFSPRRWWSATRRCRDTRPPNSRSTVAGQPRRGGGVQGKPSPLTGVTTARRFPALRRRIRRWSRPLLPPGVYPGRERAFVQRRRSGFGRLVATSVPSAVRSPRSRRTPRGHGASWQAFRWPVAGFPRRRSQRARIETEVPPGPVVVTADGFRWLAAPRGRLAGLVFAAQDLGLMATWLPAWPAARRRWRGRRRCLRSGWRRSASSSVPAAETRESFFRVRIGRAAVGEMPRGGSARGCTIAVR